MIFPGIGAARGVAAAALIASLALPPAAAAATRGEFDWGARLRLRQEYLANVYDLSEAAEDDHNSIRVRPQIWGSWAPGEHWKLYALLTNEHRHWLKSNRGLEDRDFEIHELIFENLWIEGKRLGGTPFGFVLGRQNLFYGDGFVCWDGGPLDGSRTAYFNALVLKAEFEKRRVEAHFISNPERDEYLPVANDQDQSLVEWKETGAGLSYVDESAGERKIEAYYLYKNEWDEDMVFPKSDVHTFGARVSGHAPGSLSFVLEAAVQLGNRGASDRFGYGGQATVRRALPSWTLSGGGIYLSGDDQSSDGYEGWNPVYSRWPKWSELYIYTLAGENGPAYWQNVASGWLGADISPGGRLALEMRAHFLWAPEALLLGCGPHCPALPTHVSDDFDYRGTLSIVKLVWNAGPRVGGHLLWEMFEPGEYYEYSGRRNAAHFLRWEMLLAY